MMFYICSFFFLNYYYFFGRVIKSLEWGVCVCVCVNGENHEGSGAGMEIVFDSSFAYINVGLHLIHDHHTKVSEFQKIIFNCICLDIF